MSFVNDHRVGWWKWPFLRHFDAQGSGGDEWAGSIGEAPGSDRSNTTLEVPAGSRDHRRITNREL